MQNVQMAAMGAMNANAGGPVDGTPMMAHMARPGDDNTTQDPRNLLNTYIYDYFLRNSHYQLAKAMVESNLPVNVKPRTKQSPGSRNVNGVDAMDGEGRPDLPLPNLPPSQVVENSFLFDWWCQFWDIFSARRDPSRVPQKTAQYTQHARNLSQMQNDQRTQRMQMMNQAQYQSMMRGIPNGVDPNNLKRAALSRNPNGVGPMGNMNMNKQAIIQSAQMQRDGSGMDLNGQRAQSPASAENAPSPNKRPRVEGAMPVTSMAGGQFNEFAQGQNVQQKPMEVYAQNMFQQTQRRFNNHVLPQAMNSGVQGSPMNHGGLDGQQDLFNQSRGVPNAPQGQGNHALQDYQMQLMLLEQQNKKRLLMARQEQDMTQPHAQGAVGGQFPPSMSPGGSRAGPSPNPTDMKRGTPKLPQQGLPTSPMPDPSMQQRGSPAPMAFDPSQMPPGMPPQIPGQFPGYNQMQQPMMRPPSSHPNFNGQQLTPQQMEMMRQNGGMPNGGPWRGPGPQGMFQPGQQPGGPMNNMPQRGQMPPPPAPPAGEQPRAEPSPSQPAAPPTPKTQTKKKPTKDTKKPAKAKGANTGATPASTAEDPPPTPTPPTPITPMHKQSFAQNGQQPNQSAPQPAAVPPPPLPMDHGPPFGDGLDNGDFPYDFNNPDILENFRFEEFMNMEGDDGNLLGTDFGFPADEVQAGGDL